MKRPFQAGLFHIGRQTTRLKQGAQAGIVYCKSLRHSERFVSCVENINALLALLAEFFLAICVAIPFVWFVTRLLLLFMPDLNL